MSKAATASNKNLHRTISQNLLRRQSTRSSLKSATSRQSAKSLRSEHRHVLPEDIDALHRDPQIRAEIRSLSSRTNTPAKSPASSSSQTKNFPLLLGKKTVTLISLFFFLYFYFSFIYSILYIHILYTHITFINICIYLYKILYYNFINVIMLNNKKYTKCLKKQTKIFTAFLFFFTFFLFFYLPLMKNRVIFRLIKIEDG